jgi:type I restriction enzyme S subunit
MSFPRYEQYKDSGVEWLGEVPEGWEVLAVWLLFELGRGRVISNGGIMDNAGVYPVYSSQTENNGEMGRLNTFDFDGDYITWTTDGANAGTVFRRSGKFNCTNVCGTLKARNEKAVLDYCTHALSISTASFVRQDINPKLMNNVMAKIRIPIPSLPEQHIIAAFLNRETGKIDALVAEQEQLLTLLKEKRQAVISLAVTKGLNPDAQMKDSGIEWLGEVPERWEVKQLKHLVRAGTSVTYGIVQAGPHYEGGIPYIKTSDMSGDCLPIDGYALTSPEIDSAYMRSKVEKGDLVISIRATVGKCLPVPNEIIGANLTQGTAKISPGSYTTREYLLFCINAIPSQAYFDHVSKGATFKEITLDALRRTPLTVPSLKEQSAIVTFLDSETAKIDALVGEVPSGHRPAQGTSQRPDLGGGYREDRCEELRPVGRGGLYLSIVRRTGQSLVRPGATSEQVNRSYPAPWRLPKTAQLCCIAGCLRRHGYLLSPLY